MKLLLAIILYVSWLLIILFKFFRELKRMDSSNMSTTPTFPSINITRNTPFSPNNTLNNTSSSATPNIVVLTYVGILVCIITFALLGNLIVIIVFLIDRKLRVSSSYYIFSLAVADVITAALVIIYSHNFI